MHMLCWATLGRHSRGQDKAPTREKKAPHHQPKKKEKKNYKQLDFSSSISFWLSLPPNFSSSTRNRIGKEVKKVLTSARRRESR